MVWRHGKQERTNKEQPVKQIGLHGTSQGVFINFFALHPPLLRRQILVEKGSFLQEAPYNLLILGRNLIGGNP